MNGTVSTMQGRKIFFFAHLGITNPQILSDVYKLNKYVE